MAGDWRAPEPLIGRETELQRLRTLTGIDDPTTRGAVLLSGDAGIGKTRLLRELASVAHDAGHRVVVGHCLDLGDSVVPFQPFAEVLVSLDEPTRTALSSTWPPLGPLMWGAAIGERVDRGELFSAVVAALETLAEEAPLLVVLEDVHWADASTRHLIRFVLTQRYAAPVRIVTSYRSDDLHRQHPLRRDVAEWGRLPDVARLDLAPLDDDDVRALVTGRGNGEIDAGGVAAIVHRAEGNAFIAEELMDVEDTSGPLPPTLADLLLVRLDRLDETARHVVRAVSVAGGEVDDDLLAAVSGLPPVEVETALRAALDHRILSLTRSRRYAFRHALLGEAVRDDLLPSERRRLHAAYLEAIGVDGDPADAARHAFEAGRDDVAFVASLRAARRASALAGHDEATRHYERVLSVASHAPDDVDLVGVVIEASDAAIAAGWVRRAQSLLDGFLDSSPRLTEEERARVLVAHANAVLLGDRPEGIPGLLDELFRIVPEQPTALRVSVETLAARVALSERRLDDALRWSAQAGALARRLGLPTLVTDAAVVEARVRSRFGDDPSGDERRFSELATQAAADGDVLAELRARHHLAFLHHDRGLLAPARDEFLRVMEIAGSAGRPWAPYGFDGRFFAAVTGYLVGDWALVDRLTDTTGLRPPKVAAACLDAVALQVSAARGDTAALARAERLRRSFWMKDIALAIHAGAAAIDLAPDAVAAREWHDDLVDVLTRVWGAPYGPYRVRVGSLLVSRLADEASTASTAARSEARATAARLRAAADRAIEEQGPFGPEGQAWDARLDAEILRLRWSSGDDVDHDTLAAAWREAVDRFAALGQVYEEARSALRLVAVLQAGGDIVAAKEVASKAYEQASALGAAPLAAALEQVASSAGASAPRRPGPAEVPGEKPLTAREREVLEQLVLGRTNGQIAATLFISTKTVSVHVSNILAKLGAATRTEAAAIARRDG